MRWQGASIDCPEGTIMCMNGLVWSEKAWCFKRWEDQQVIPSEQAQCTEAWTGFFIS